MSLSFVLAQPATAGARREMRTPAQRRLQATDAERRGAAARQRRSAQQLFWPSVRCGDAVFLYHHRWCPVAFRRPRVCANIFSILQNVVQMQSFELKLSA